MSRKERLLDIYSDGGEWEDFEPVIDEMENELATLRAQLAEAKDIIIVLAWLDEILQPDESKEFVSVNILTSTIKKARAWYDKVTTD